MCLWLTIFGGDLRVSLSLRKTVPLCCHCKHLYPNPVAYWYLQQPHKRQTRGPAMRQRTPFYPVMWWWACVTTPPTWMYLVGRYVVSREPDRSLTAVSHNANGANLVLIWELGLINSIVSCVAGNEHFRLFLCGCFGHCKAALCEGGRNIG